MDALVSALSDMVIDAEAEFAASLRRLKYQALKQIDTRDIEKPLRHLVHEELSRRKVEAENNRANNPPKKKNKKPSKRAKKTPEWSMRPDLHQLVASELPRENLTWHSEDTESGVIKDYDTNVIGSFTCPNKNCKKPGWNSWTVAITVRRYSSREYNVRIWHQHCIACGAVAIPELDADCYVERVVYRLKKWFGYRVKTEGHIPGANGPHEEELCEGCMHGHCPWLRRKEVGV